MFKLKNWTRIDSWSFISFALGMFLEAYIFGMASIATTWVTIPLFLKSLLLSWSPIWLIVGIAFAGPLADKFGRKNVFYATMAIYAVGAIGIVFSYSYYLILIFLALLLLAAGGEMNTIMVFTHEIMPREHRSSSMLLEVDFISIGGLVLALVSFSTAYSSIMFQRLMIGITMLIVLAILAIARSKIPESFLWLASRGNKEQARMDTIKYYGNSTYLTRTNNGKYLENEDTEKIKKLPLKLFAAITMAFADGVGFGLVAYVLGPIYFEKYTALILLVASIAGAFAGLIGFLGSRIGRKSMLLYGYTGAFIVTLLTYATIRTWTTYLIFFWLIVIAVNAFISIAYVSEEAYKSEIWDTRHRASYTALIRFTSAAAYIVVIYTTASLSLNSYILFNIFVWAVGVIGAASWYVFGYETGKNIPVEEINA